jgi:SIR2-like domain/Tetratricopeptide repeat/AAA domain
LKAAIANGKALLVCGAGVSTAVTGGAALGWKGLIENAIDFASGGPGDDWSVRCKENLKSVDTDLWLTVADFVQRKMGGWEGSSYRAWLKESVGKLEAKNPDLLDAIKDLQCRVATTNYDELLRNHLDATAVTWLDTNSVAEGLIEKRKRLIWHIHGVWYERESVIFSASDYARVGANAAAQFLQQHAAFADTIIFIGCSNDGLADQNIGKLLDWFSGTWGGLGKKHFALVRDSDLAAPGWPNAVTRIRYGAEFGDLPNFIHGLAPPRVQASVANSIAEQIPETPTFGRDHEIDLVVRAAGAAGTTFPRKPCIITGLLGAGKTKVAIAAAYRPEMVTQFGARRIFVNLEGHSDPLDILILLAGELGLKPEPTQSSTLAAIRYSCQEAAAFAILDNAEKLAEEKQLEAARILGLISNIPNLSIVVTSRAPFKGLAGWEKIDHLPPLPLDKACSLFCSIATSITLDDPDLQPLLEAMEGHALSLTILASRVDNDLSLKPMLERWEREKGQLLTLKPEMAEDRTTSTRASLRLSLTSKHMTSMARRLLTVLGFLPGGLPSSGLKGFLGREDLQLTSKKSDDATEVLRRLRLVMPRPDGSIRLINPLRECVRLELPLKSPDLDRVVTAGLKLMTKAGRHRTESRPEVQFHLGNFAEILTAVPRVRSMTKVKDALESARVLTTDASRMTPNAFLDLAKFLREYPNSQSAIAQALGVAGSLSMQRHDLEGAKKHLEEARAISVEVHDEAGEANALFVLGDLALRRGDLEGAKTNLEASRAILARIKNSSGEANVLLLLGDLALRHADLEGAKLLHESGREISARAGNRLGEASALLALGDLALRREDLEGAKTLLEASRTIHAQIGNSLGEADALAALGALALRCDDLEGAKTFLEDSRAIHARIGNSLGEGNAVERLGTLALRRDDLEGASTLLEAARTIHARIGDSLGEANALQTLGTLALRRNDLDAAKTFLETARAIHVRIDNKLGEANTLFLVGLVLTQEDTARAETALAEALRKYRDLNDRWGIAQTELRLAQIAAARGDPGRLASATAQLLELETGDQMQLAGPGWRDFCASLLENDPERRQALREGARASWTAIGALGLVREMLDFKIEIRP